MPALELALLELKRFLRSRLTRAALVALLLLPLLYGALYLWAFWDPYGRLDKIPVALVSTDKPVTAGSQRVDAGAQLERSLLERHTFDWQVVDPATAESGVRSGRYYLSLTIPADFSAHLASPATASPAAGQLEVRTNDATNYLAGQISRSVFAEIRAAAGRSAIRAYFDRIFVSFADIHAETVKAAQGAGQLANGADSAKSGAGRLVGGLDQASAGSGQLADGLAQLDAGAARLQAGSAQAAAGTQALAGRVDAVDDKLEPVLRSHVHEIQAGATLVADGAQLVADHVADLPAVTAKIVQRTAAAEAALDHLAEEQPWLRSDRWYQEARQAAADASAAARRAHDTVVAEAPELAKIRRDAARIAVLARRVAAEAPTLADRLHAARAQVDRLNAGVNRVAAGAAQLHDGTGQALAAAQRLHGGIGQLGSGARQLQGGIGQLSSGAHRLTDGLSAGARRIPAYDEQQRGTRTGMMSEPVRLSKDQLNPVRNYGTGFAPYFIPLALWVGSMFCFMLLRPVSSRALASTAPPWRVALAGWLPAAAIGVVQVLALLAVLRYAIGLHLVHPLGAVAFLALTALAFAAVLQWVHAKFGVVGRLIALVLLMVQLTSAGGTYPVETSPGFFQAVHPYLPMTYVVTGLRHLISGGSLGPVWQASGVLAAFLAGGLALSSLTSQRMRVWSLRRLHPELAV